MISQTGWSPQVRELVTAPLIGYTVLNWSDLQPETRRISFPVPSTTWAALRASAAAEELSLAAWCEKTLAAAAGVS